MSKFTLAGREWHWPKFTTRVLNRFRDEFKLDLRALLRKDSSDIALALADDGLLVAAFLAECAAQVEASGLTRDQLEEAWDGPANLSAREALVESFFTHSQGPARAAKVMERMRAAGL